jgi:uncharacterized membrane protein
MGLRRLMTLMGFGAGLMYFYDPQLGRRRRALLRDQWTHLQNEAGDFMDKARRDLRNRQQGMQAQGITGAMGGLSGQWTPGVRLVAALAGGGMTFYGLARSGVSGLAATFLGLDLVSRGLTNTGLRQSLNVQGSGENIDFHKTLFVNAPVNEVFQFWRNYQNFPRFMSHVKDVRDTGNGQSHWVVEGPGGTDVEWNARITDLEPDHVIAWQSQPDSAVYNAGRVRFDSQDGGTRVNVHLMYRPPAGKLGQAVAALFNADPKSAMDEDMVHFKSLVEHGKTTTDGQTVTRQDVSSGGSSGQKNQGRSSGTGSTGSSSTSTSGTSGQRSGGPMASGEKNGPQASRPDGGRPGGGQGRTDQVGQTGVYPASDPNAPDDATTQGMASWGQGERGAAGYADSGGSELDLGGETGGFDSMLPGNPAGPEGEK